MNATRRPAGAAGARRGISARGRAAFTPVLATLTFACSPPSPPPGTTEGEATIAEVEAAVWAFHAADTARNAEGVIDLLWPEYSMLADGQRVGYSDVVEGSRAFMASLELFHTEWTDLRVEPLGPGFALASFRFRDSILTADGSMIRNQGPTTFLWERRGGEWRLIFADADHYPLDP